MNEAEHYPFCVRPLPYPVNALSPWINSAALKLHHDSHYAGYIKNLNEVLKDYSNLHHLSLEALLVKQAFLPDSIRPLIKKFAGGAYNHQMYFECLTPPKFSKISPEFDGLIADNFGSLKNLTANLKEAAMAVFGSGYACLVSDMGGKMHIILLSNQETPIERRLNLILPIDVWEHAYYLQYQNHRERYLNNILKLINWKKAEQNYYT